MQSETNSHIRLLILSCYSKYHMSNYIVFGKSMQFIHVDLFTIYLHKIT